MPSNGPSVPDPSNGDKNRGGRSSEKIDGQPRWCILGQHWSTDWKLKQHYCDPHWREYKRKQKSIARHKAVFIKAQDACPICQRRLEEFKTSNLHVDHDHGEAFRIRGLLCLNCNAILGHSRDDPQVLLRAIDYINSREGAYMPLEEALAKAEAKIKSQAPKEPSYDLSDLFDP